MGVENEVIVVGGGMAGLVCANRLAKRGLLDVLIDSPVEGTGVGLGGFAEFSGAKFSLLPAGQGLIRAAGSEAALQTAMNDTVALLGLGRFPLVQSRDTGLLSGASESELQIRAYGSYLLSTNQVRTVVKELGEALPPQKVVSSRVESVKPAADGAWQVRTSDGNEYSGRSVVFATGRTGATLLQTMGAEEQPGKGVDLGVRLEFSDKNALAPLRQLGADAKILMGNCRTFCLNSPGRIFRYVSELGVSIPGGVVAETGEQAGNVGILCRVQAKADAIAALRQSLIHAADEHLTYAARSASSAIRDDVLQPLFGTDVVNQLATFTRKIEEAGLVNFAQGCTVHYPLMDWHWPTFAFDRSFATSLPGVFVIGDLSGHARGLLQSAVAGWLMAERLS